MEIKGNLKGEINIKRFYMNGLDIKSKCTNCEHVIEYDDYLSYPEMNKENDMHFYCHECENEWYEKVKLNVELIN